VERVKNPVARGWSFDRDKGGQSIEPEASTTPTHCRTIPTLAACPDGDLLLKDDESA
jgi:hypothetical protein